jgi:mannose-6-phosphate isomerase-like protein (cupin superfamily)
MAADDMARLRELADLVRSRAPGVTYYADGDNGETPGQWLFTEPRDPANGLWPGGAGQLARMQVGSRFGLHVHLGSTEVLVVVCGVLEVWVTGSGSRLRMCPGDVLRLNAGEQHQAEAVTDCVVVGITVPRDGGYPDGPDTCIQPGPAE